ncbi:MAG: phosphoribosylglycinamide formyltransferase [Chloroflexota bacterium]
MLRIGWFSTGRDKEARDLLEVVQREIAAGTISATISFVFSNREPGEREESDAFFDLVRSYNIPLICLSSQRFKSQFNKSNIMSSKRLEFDRKVMKQLEPLGADKADLCVLAGYMLIVGEEMCRKYTMLNLHPAPPHGPAGTWQEVIWQLIQNRAEKAGAMMHLVTPELDKGPPVTYCTFPITGEPFDPYWQRAKEQTITTIKEQEGENNPLFKLIREQEVKRELPLIVATLRALSEGKVRIEKGKVLDSSGREIDGYDLSEEIERMVKEQQ